LEQGGVDQTEQREEIEQENVNPGKNETNQNFMLEKETQKYEEKNQFWYWVIFMQTYGCLTMALVAILIGGDTIKGWMLIISVSIFSPFFVGFVILKVLNKLKHMEYILVFMQAICTIP
jgi:hypothetical protein